MLDARVEEVNRDVVLSTGDDAARGLKMGGKKKREREMEWRNRTCP